ncbi:DivIVA domain-containing protein [Baekduia soli]|uniref:Cell wall synthesis protein Wag31 n=1 Tax=Baekduia soli TaxID=496014 RepID=A0A5B8U8Y7_9ACTN|nr:DivIVA domain-containing protein [Baekduia soli]QEC49596.1 DivIVA domain-containing protein [Baekduia soli]
MALDRQTIEKRDFPIGRRGYEPEAVDAHLAQVAEQVEELRRRVPTGGAAQKASPASIAQAASEQVRAIVEAAETSAADIERAAQDEAARIREDAEADAKDTRDDAVSQSQEHVGRVRQATTQMLQRVDAMEGELKTLIESLRTGANRLTADLSLLEGGMGDLYDASGRARTAPAPAAAAPIVESVPVAVAPTPFTDDDDDDDDDDDVVILNDAAVDDRFEAHETPAAPVAAAAAPAEPAPAEAAPVSQGDVEGARLVALNMALNGTAREETDRYLAENFDLADRAALLDEVYATVES